MREEERKRGSASQARFVVCPVTNSWGGCAQSGERVETHLLDVAVPDALLDRVLEVLLARFVLGHVDVELVLRDSPQRGQRRLAVQPQPG